MSALFRIVYAAHANGTHHKLALDALRQLPRTDAEAWTRVFLKHADVFMDGAKAPDTSFKDFKNHVLHVADGYWGGAPEKVEAWYGHTVTALKARNWAEAAYAAGVLSHYYTDPVHPFHTAQTEAENAIHRAVEWSINRSYNDLRALAEARHGGLDVAVPEGAHWLRDMVCDGAEFSNRYYEKLIAHYDFTRGVVEPREGLDEVGRGVIAELLMYAATGFSRILDRAISEAGVAAPDVSLTLDTIIAALKIPAKALAKRLSNAEDRALVQAMYDELQATGRVERTLPEDDRTIRDLYAREVLAAKLEKQAAKRATRVPAGDPADVRRAAAREAAKRNPIAPPVLAGTKGSAAPVVAAVAAVAAPPVPRAASDLPPPMPAASLNTSVPTVVRKPALADAAVLPPELPNAAPPSAPQTQAPLQAPPKLEAARPPEAAKPEAAKPAPAPAPTPAPTPESAKPAPAPTPITAQPPRATAPAEPRRSYLREADDLEAAPSIGPKLAKRFADLGIRTVADFMSQDPADMAELLDDSRITADTLYDWQDQAQLVIEVPGLRGSHAQMLVGAGYRTSDAIAAADPVALSADVLTFATSSEGKRLLRDSPAPDLEKIKAWADLARAAIAA